MMTAPTEDAAIRRTQTLAQARRLASDWGYWCVYGKWGAPGGAKPMLDTGGPERYYRAPPMWHPPEPRIPEANDIAGMAVQKAYIHLPLDPYRRILAAEFVHRPWIVPLKEGELEVFVARRARVSLGAYAVTLERALLALANVMKRKNLWQGA